MLDQQYLVNYQQIVEYHWPEIFPNMSGMGRCADKRIERNVAYLLRCPESTVPEAMQACKYSTNKNVNTTKQMAVGCTHKKAIDAKKKATPQM